MNLWHDFMTNNGKAIHKWVHYFPVYERHFASWQGKTMTFLEIGVSKGGSLGMWQRYFGPLAVVVGIDIDPACKEHESPGINIRIGDQSDEKFLASVVSEFGIPDVVLDDGSHIMSHVNKTFEYFYPMMPKNSVYMVEDMHTAYWEEFGGGVDEPMTFINKSKSIIDSINADHSRGRILPDHFTKDTFCISYYDSIVVLEKGHIVRKEAPVIGEVML